MTWTDLSSAFTYGSKLTSAQMQGLRDNITALANGDSGAPAVQTAALDSSVVTTAKIADYNVTNAKLGSASVGADKIGTGAVTEAKIGTGAVTTDKIYASAVSQGKIADYAISEIKLASSSVSQAKLKTSTGYDSGLLSGGSSVNILLQDYTFMLAFWADYTDIYVRCYYSVTDPSNYAAKYRLYTPSGGNYDCRFRYITSSDRPFIYALRNPISGEIINIWACEDPPYGYWGLDEKPIDFKPPIEVFDKDNNKIFGEDIVFFNYNKVAYRELFTRMEKDKKVLHNMITEEYELIEGNKIFTRKNLAQV